VIAKAVNPDPQFWGMIKQEAPEIFLIGRKYFDPQPWSDPGRVARSILDMGALHIMDAWEGLNEPNRNRITEACDLDYHVARMLHDEGIQYICGSWSVGVPDIPEWQLPVMLEALRVADYIGVHAYSAPSMDDPRGVVWWMLRHRLWYPDLPDDCKKPLLITEIGIDSGAVHWDPGAQGGWRSFTDAADYADQLAWLDAELQLDSYVKGALSYQWGSLDPTWDSHDWTRELVPLLREYIISQQGRLCVALCVDPPRCFGGVVRAVFRDGSCYWAEELPEDEC
jgi:hypothetical protein